MTNAAVLAGIIGDVSAAQTSAGSSQATAAVAVADHVHVPSVGTGEGVILRAGNANDVRSVSNGDASDNLYVYPPTDASFNGASANAPIDLPPRSGALFIFVTSTKINAIV